MPLPSLEVVLIPMILRNPAGWLLYSLEGAAGTAVGGWIGYQLGKGAHRTMLSRWTSPQQMERGRQLMNRYGVAAVLIGGITPIPDFILAYLAGMCAMPLIRFLLSDALARLSRSFLISGALLWLGYVVDIERWGTVISLVTIAWFLLRWAGEQEQTKKKGSVS